MQNFILHKILKAICTFEKIYLSKICSKLLDVLKFVFVTIIQLIYLITFCPCTSYFQLMSMNNLKKKWSAILQSEERRILFFHTDFTTDSSNRMDWLIVAIKDNKINIIRLPKTTESIWHVECFSKTLLVGRNTTNQF